jgi:hypothetical protein
MRRWQSMLALALLLVLAVPASGSTFLHMSRAELAAKANAVVTGEVLEVNSFWDEKGQIIVTEAMVRVEDNLVGDSASVVAVRTFGGTVDGFTVEAHGFPVFAEGDRVLLFLENDRRTPDAHRVLGFQEGHYRLVREQKSGRELAVPTVDRGAHLLTADGRPAPTPRVVPLAELRTEIRQSARRAGRIVH